MKGGMANGDTVLELTPGFYAIGGSLPADAAINWLARGLTGRLPAQCYLLRGRDRSLLVDTGLPIHWRRISAALDRLLDGCPRLDLLVTRWEPDTINNMPPLTQSFNVETVYSVGELNPLDFFDGIEAASLAAQVNAAAPGLRRVAAVPGDIVATEDFSVEFLRSTLRVLLTNWLYEHRTRTLFCSDTWNVFTDPAADGPVLLRPEPASITSARVKAAMRQKMDWLRGADSAPLIEDLRAMQKALVVDRVCPSFGAVVEGREAVTRLFDATCEALEQLGDEPSVQPLDGVDLRRALREPAVVDVENRAPPVSFASSAAR